jgi:hypothetical protein
MTVMRVLKNKWAIWGCSEYFDSNGIFAEEADQNIRQYSDFQQIGTNSRGGTTVVKRRPASDAFTCYVKPSCGRENLDSDAPLSVK